MTSTIGNPLSWWAKNISAAGHEVGSAVRHAGGDGSHALPEIRTVTFADLRAVLRLGVDDFMTFRSDVLIACLLYPVIGGALIWIAVHQDALPLAFPLLSGFALIGPVAAIGLYELSRRREAGEEPTWSDMIRVLHAPGFGAILMLGFALAIVFILWLLCAWLLHSLTMGDASYTGAAHFIGRALTTPGGWAMILIGIPLGFCFALLVLAVSVVSFPMLLDRDVGLPRAIITSVGVLRKNPVTILAWGAIVAAGLILGALPMLLGFAVTLPILGHATWHLYRRAVA
ncbi:MAG: DUF2189 domain-containing protein [Proteobacteria bacterium]|nr:DUF2189 domain-containing protein [Pseudomonadota bacterium]MBS0572379.1 DUF2189 domain-containing protein [Pseudomonadota bacterium]